MSNTNLPPQGGPQQPYQQQPYTPQQPQQPESGKHALKPRRKWLHWIAYPAVAFVSIGIGAAGGGDTPAASSPTPTATVTTTAKPTAEPTTTAAPAEPETTTPAAPETASTPTATAKPKPTATAKPKPVVYKKLTARQWAKVAKSPDQYTGQAFIVHGRVTQFDSATGATQFRADVGGVKLKPSYGYVDYDTNTLLSNVSGDVSDLVEDDLFTANVIVVGAYTYETSMGGEMTVPQLSVMSIKVTGSLK